MKSLRRQLPPMTALMAFEAAARLLSFTRAAEELGVTQAAVSRQIHALEEDFGLPLFNRLHRKVTLTAQGQALAAATSNAFGLIADAASDLRQGSNDDLTISATVAFSHFWLLPRISEFSRRHPDTTLRIVSQDAMPALDQGDVDVAIRFGEGNWPNVQAEKLFDDLVFPVCSPEFALSLDPDLPPEDLIRKPLISHEADDPMWIGWIEWLSHFGVTTTGRLKGMRCSFYTEAIYATLNGQGITLGWNRLVGDLIDQNRLVRLGDASLVPKGGYYVLVPAKRRQSQALQQFMTWLFESHSGT
ncbi:DNA-binding transcriptional LysR family regulator [Rhizobium rosettiformans]|uniref:LysR family transcriptional regulator n=2 Tax=Rhizobium rosettiformans TaxID=1368430 RepID=A0A4S8PWU4_9HYPH|nr:LysR substrate-binding domain-containing protein [Rhizobium rosettiformans]MBB5277257.1 DNA-binding transcriptional LysR family regulator [Rhizobium rosettiformans]THV34515.1 LysR family transcriptional regulator [Rhizobium rosettiformans W3]